MKNKFIGALAFTALVIVCTACSSTPHYAEDYPDLTPENSVIAYGFDINMSYIQWAQINSALPADAFSFNTGWDKSAWFTRPLPLTSVYKNVYEQKMVSAGRTTYIYTTKCPLNIKSDNDIVVQKTPGLQLIHIEKAVGWSQYRTEKACELAALNTMLSAYKHTAWETVIRERIDQVKKGVDNEKDSSEKTEETK